MKRITHVLVIFFLFVPKGYSVTKGDLKSYLSVISTMFVGRPITNEEEKILELSDDGLSIILNDWTRSEFFNSSARMYVESALQVGGGGFYGNPGEIFTEIVKFHKPYKEILSRCASVDGSRQFCDSGAPFSAGVLTTRAFLKAHSGRFNLARASTLIREFLCSEYPIKRSLEPKVERSALREMFQSLAGNDAFGNGASCYSCHGQFAKHAQLFVKFDRDGYWAPFASGLQDEAREPGVSDGVFYASHFQLAQRAKQESSEILSQPVENLAEAGKIIVSSDLFYSCAEKKILKYFLQLDSESEMQIKELLIEEIANSALSISKSPSFQNLVYAAFTNPHVINSVLEGRK